MCVLNPYSVDLDVASSSRDKIFVNVAPYNIMSIGLNASDWTHHLFAQSDNLARIRCYDPEFDQ